MRREEKSKTGYFYNRFHHIDNRDYYYWSTRGKGSKVILYEKDGKTTILLDHECYSKSDKTYWVEIPVEEVVLMF